MFKADIDLVNEQVRKYGLLEPMVDLGGLAKPTIADYAITIRTGNQQARYITLPNGARPFDAIDPMYLILNPEKGDPPIEDLSKKYGRAAFGTVVCLNVIEHVVNPFEVFLSLNVLTRKGGLVIISTVFSFPYHPSPIDYWRFSPECLKMLANSVGFQVLEAGWHLTVLANEGIQEIHTGEPQEVRAVYITMRR